MSESSIELAQFFELPELDLEAYHRFADLAYASAAERDRFITLTGAYQERVASGGGDPLRVALALEILGRFTESLGYFAKAGKNALGHWFHAAALIGLRREDDAIEQYEKAAAAGWDPLECAMATAEAHIRAGRIDKAEKIIEKHATAGGDRASWYAVAGMLAERKDDKAGALEHYERALKLDPNHVIGAYRAAWLYDLRGEDENAISLYERLAHQPRARVNALINLAVIHEDNGRFEDAMMCLRRVLVAYPNHTRARLFLKDVESSREMVIDDAVARQIETRDRLLEMPITEFELSVRARNCLKKMKIQSLGDLLRLREEELLSFKNFGETSLNEIRQLLSRRGLSLGQRPEDIDPTKILDPAAPAARVNVPPGAEAALQKPVAELELSVRARRCLQRLNIVTIGDLIQHSENDLLSTRNFGVTSLNEIKGRLADMNLELAPKQ